MKYLPATDFKLTERLINRKSQICNDNDGSYNCACNAGWYLGSDNRECYNVNECDEGNHQCPQNSQCIDNTGSFDCKCNTGYSGESCLNINECTAGTHTCRSGLK